MQYFIKAVAALALVAVLATAPAAPAWADAAADYKAGRAAEKAGDFDTAIRIYTRIIQSGLTVISGVIIDLWIGVSNPPVHGFVNNP